MEKKSRQSTFAGKLAAYSATAGAALLSASGAQAAVTNITSADFTFTGGNTNTLPPAISLPGGANESFLAAFFPLKFTAVQGAATYATLASGVVVRNAAGFSVEGSGNHNLFNLNANASIKGGQFIPGGRAFLHGASVGTSGAFLPARVSGATANGYVGLKGSHSGHLYYGWLRLKVTNNSNGIPIQMSLIAADGHPDIYGAFDRADQVDGDMFKTGSVAAVPEPSITALGGLGLLALGAAGVREMRRRRSVKA